VIESKSHRESAKQWWATQRSYYNTRIAIAYSVAAICSMLVLRWVSSLSPSPAGTTAHWMQPIAFAVFGSTFALLLANLFYFLGPLSERVIRPRSPDRFRRMAFRLGIWFSVLLPFAIPALLLCFGLLGALMGQGTPVSATELAGMYVADYGAARSTLTLTASGRFSQEVKVKATGETATASGTWEFEPSLKKLYLRGGFMGVIDFEGKLAPGLGRPPRGSIAVLQVRRTAWALELGGDDIPWNRGPAETPYTKQLSRPRK
jgi:hypothetical protein